MERPLPILRLATVALCLLACSSGGHSSEGGSDASVHEDVASDIAVDAALDVAPVADVPLAPDIGVADVALIDAVDEGSTDVPPTTAEQEPNDGATATDFQTITVPATVSGAVGKPDDIDVYGFTAVAGDRFTVAVESAGTLQAHVAVFGAPGLDVPATVNAGPGDGTMVEIYVLKSGQYLIAVRDRRNVGDSSAHVGGAGYSYTLTLQLLDRAPVPIAIGSETAALLDPPGTAAVFSFEAVQDDDVTIRAVAEDLTPPSGVDTQIALFFPAKAAVLGINDDADLATSDSMLQGPLPFTGTYHVIVQDVGPGAGARNVVLKVQPK